MWLFEIGTGIALVGLVFTIGLLGYSAVSYGFSGVFWFSDPQRPATILPSIYLFCASLAGTVGGIWLGIAYFTPVFPNLWMIVVAAAAYLIALLGGYGLLYLMMSHIYRHKRAAYRRLESPHHRWV